MSSSAPHWYSAGPGREGGRERGGERGERERERERGERKGERGWRTHNNLLHVHKRVVRELV